MFVMDQVMKPVHTGPLRFGNFEFDPVSGELRKHKLAVRLTPQARALLCVLLETPLRVHNREDIQMHLWPKQRFLDFEHGLNKIVHSLRDALGDTGTNPRFIETIAGSGYRFNPEWLQSSSYASSVLKGGTGYSVAVLPVFVTGGLQGYQFRTGRMTSDLSDSLSAISGLRVLAQGMVKSHNMLGASPQTVGQSMGVRAVLAGELMLRETSFYIRMELIDVSDGAQLSVARIERPFNGGQQLEKEVGDEILRQLRPALVSLAVHQPLLSATESSSRIV
jgi:DNA-binding winged helix-turn-helix (wHTH) protein